MEVEIEETKNDEHKIENGNKNDQNRMEEEIEKEKTNVMQMFLQVQQKNMLKILKKNV